MRAAGLLLAAAALLPACDRFSTPERSCERLLQAVAADDVEALFDTMLPTTRKSFNSVRKNHGKIRELVAENYPAEDRAAALGRLYGAQAESGLDLFTRIYRERHAADYRARLGSGPAQVTVLPATQPAHAKAIPQAECRRQNGRPFRLSRGSSGFWGFAELDVEWDLARLRAIQDLSTVEKNVELYRRVHQ